MEIILGGSQKINGEVLSPNQYAELISETLQEVSETFNSDLTWDSYTPRYHFMATDVDQILQLILDPKSALYDDLGRAVESLGRHVRFFSKDPRGFEFQAGFGGILSSTPEKAQGTGIRFPCKFIEQYVSLDAMLKLLWEQIQRWQLLAADITNIKLMDQIMPPSDEIHGAPWGPVCYDARLLDGDFAEAEKLGFERYEDILYVKGASLTQENDTAIDDKIKEIVFWFEQFQI
ncbi:hypothetical protein CA11_09870 [Gimesia maris]|uniref:hypothetical protein n=1 Tax=Gimesia maris TaxID=122 RepID=UPI00118C03A8|nr:hypothetical protein [Gimesia maris]QDU13205.1 hypothetical protein CA11_09870 [Gimesia maris]